MAEAGYLFEARPASEAAECGVCSGENPAELVARLAYQKAADVVAGVDAGLVLGCDTVAECRGRILGKPVDVDDARQMLHMLRGREHRVFSGLCLWQKPGGHRLVDVDITRLRMDPLSDAQINEYLDSGAWEGKAGAFGFQDQLGWVHVLEGSESNVVGLPLELLARMLEEFSI